MPNEDEANTSKQFVKNQSIKFLQFLSAASQEAYGIRRTHVRKLSQHKVVFAQPSLRSSRYILVGPSQGRDSWMEISKAPQPKPVSIPRVLQRFIDKSTVSAPDSRPTLSTKALDESFPVDGDAEGAPHSDQSGSTNKYGQNRQFLRQSIEYQFTNWLTSTWEPWHEQNAEIVRANKLYEQFYTMLVAHDNQQESLEIVWGHGVLHYQNTDDRDNTVDYPIIITEMSIAMDASTGAITLTPNGNPQLDLTALEGTDIRGMKELSQLQRSLQDGFTTDLWNDQERIELERKIVAPLGAYAQVLDASTDYRPEQYPDPVLSDQWAIMLRPRKDRRQQFYADLSKQLQHDAFMPEALESIILDNDTIAQANGSTIPDPNQAAPQEENLLFPLPANDEQERIARQINFSSGVTVQGPPGTGKTHTIANLVSHLLSQGKRILVTSEKDQALQVLQDKIPAEIRDLTMTVVGADSTSMERMKDSSQRMQDSLSGINSRAEQATIAKEEDELTKLTERKRGLELELKRVLASEMSKFTLPDGLQHQAGEVAKWVTEHNDIDVIPDDIAQTSPFPMTDDDFNEFVRLCSVSQTDLKSNIDCGDALEQLPDAATIQQLFADLASSETTNTALENSGLNLEAIAEKGTAHVQELRDIILEQIPTAKAINPDLEHRIFDSGNFDLNLLQLVQQQNAKILQDAEFGMTLDQRLSGHTFSIPDGNATIQNAYIAIWREKLINGQKLGIFTKKEIRQFAAQVRMDESQPVTAEQLDDVSCEIQRRTLLNRTVHEFQQLLAHLGLGAGSTNDTDFFSIDNKTKVLDTLFTWRLKTRPELEYDVRALITSPVSFKDAQALRHTADLLDQASQYEAQTNLQDQIQHYIEFCNQAIKEDQGCMTWTELKKSLLTRDAAGWNHARQELHTLAESQARLTRRNVLARQLEISAPSWTEEIINSQGRAASYDSIETAKTSWKVAQARTWLHSLHRGQTTEQIMHSTDQVTQEMHRLTVELIRRKSLIQLKATTTDKDRRALATWLQATKRIGKGTGKTAPRFRAQAQEAFPGAMGAVPVWIMPLYRVFENFRPGTSKPFDVVIIDESSQCDLLSVGVLALAKKAIVVGDDKQTSPASVGTQTDNITQLQNRYLSDLPDKTLFTLDTSLYSLADRAFGNTILLREHYRCVPEIINFSNRYYNDMIVPLRENTHPEIGSPLKTCHVHNGVSIKHGNSRTNQKEAQEIAAQIVQCCRQPEYQDLTFGVVSFMRGTQSQIIEDELLKELSADEMEKHHIRVGYPPDFQGDERDIIFISMVADDNSFSATREWNHQWANVAVSRAKNQLWVFYSMDPATLNPNDARRSIIEYVSNFKETENPENLYALTESGFERDVLKQMLDRGYQVTPQYRVGSYRIDFVVTIAPGYRLAIECDGDSFHGLDKLDEDLKRQNVLERQGWNFFRIRASEYYLDPAQSLTPLWKQLEELRKEAGEETGRSLGKSTPDTIGLI